MARRKVMLTTVDNPHSPITDFASWYAWDVASGYYSSDFLARILIDSLQLSDADYDLAVEQAIDEVVRENVLGVFRKVEAEVPD